MDSDRLRTSRTLTQQGLSIFEETVARYLAELRFIRRDIEYTITEFEQNRSADVKELEILKSNLTELSHTYDKVCWQYESFLKTSRSAASAREEASYRLVSESVKGKVSLTVREIDAIISQSKGVISQGNPQESPMFKPPRSISSHRSQNKSKGNSSVTSYSKGSAVLLRQSVKLETARIQLQFAEKEAEILRQQADLEASKKVLSGQKAVAEAQSTLNVMKRVMSDGDALSAAEDDISEVADENYQQCETHAPRHSTPYNVAMLETTLKPHETASSGAEQVRPCRLISESSEIPPILNAHAKPFVPPNSSDISYLTRYIAKKDLITTRFTPYDDDPTHYFSWKSSLQNMLSELQVTPIEHVDILVNWLGPDSKRQAKSIQAANARDPAKAAKLIWERLDSRFGSPEIIENALQQRISAFPKLSNINRKEFFDLADLSAEIEAVKNDDSNQVLFTYFDSSYGINKLVSKLPYGCQEKWTSEANKYKLKNQGRFPPFTFFSTFLHNLANMKNDPGFIYDSEVSTQNRNYRKNSSIIDNEQKLGEVKASKTDVLPGFANYDETLCPLHKTKHLLNECSAFRRKTMEERKKFIQNNGICFNCCGPKKHRAKNCRELVECDICKTSLHPTALHKDSKQDEGEQSNTEVKSVCTRICGTPVGTSKSCAKILPVRIYREDKPEKLRTVYALLDDQSNRSLATSTFFDSFQDDGPVLEYVLASCAGKKLTSGRRGVGYVIESIDNTHSLKLPTLVECDDLPNNREEIPSPEVASHHPHLRDIEPFIPPIDDAVEIELLIGRDLIEAHYVLDQRIGRGHLPYAQKLPFGWVILGHVCLGKTHFPEVVNANKTFVLSNGRTSYFEPCESKLTICDNVFLKTEKDNRVGLSVDDQRFMKIMDSGFQKDSDGHWTAPLPFREDRPPLPDNKSQALKRAVSLDISLKRNPVKYEHVRDFMQKIFDRGHAEIAPPISPETERWYLPMFGVYNPKKPDSIRMVFDSSSKHHGVSLNDVLLKGPDLSNNLQGILLRFRRDKVAITADVEQMFHNFKVEKDNRDYLRFLWHPEGDLDQPLQEFRMTVHVFGNSPSPSVATYGLRKSVQIADSDVQEFVVRNFYVDDGLISCSGEDKAVSLMKRTQLALKEGGQLRLHKIASNSKTVLQQFHQDDLAKDLKNLDIGHDALPVQRSLGLSWDIETDSIIFRVSSERRPFTRRGVLSTINSLFDPIGFTSPVTLQGKLLLREIMSVSGNIDWDEPLQDIYHSRWKAWVDSLSALEKLRIPRMYSTMGFSPKLEVHIYSDASREAIAAVAYLRTDSNDSHIGFLLGKSKVAPTHGHTIPRLELCAAVLAVELAETIKEHLDIDKENFYFYVDSKVVLGYISNETRRFYVYVTNRVSRIRSFCGPEQWDYVPSECNPADIATRNFNAIDLPQSIWIQGPSFCRTSGSQENIEPFPLVDAENDDEVQKEVTCMKVKLESRLGCERFCRFSTWRSLLRAVNSLKLLARRRRCRSSKINSEAHESVEHFIIRQTQLEVFSEEIQAIMEGRRIPRKSSLLPLSPILDSHGILRVGGRTKRMSQDKVCDFTRHPIVIPKNHHIATLLIRHFHTLIHHQGRNLTDGAIRSAGYWIVGGKRLVVSVIKSCITCKKLRGKFGWFQMADLPMDRIEPGPPFTFVGVDTFGPWPVVFRKTRGGVADRKRWAILFTCMVSRAVHIELIEELSSSSFINALRRIMAIRGPVKRIWSDRGTNFVGGAKELNIDAEFTENGAVRKYLDDNGVTWMFNPPHASHFGGVWERMICSCRRILDALILEYKGNLTHEVLSTFMMEVCAILNMRPLVPVSSDPERPQVLSPSLLVTQKPLACDWQLPTFGFKDALKSQWKSVQRMADDFWARWRSEYLHHLQIRHKWESGGVTFKEGDIVLLKDNECSRNYWPMGVVDEVFESQDGGVRKAKVRVSRGDTHTSFVRPISQFVKLLELS